VVSSFALGATSAPAQTDPADAGGPLDLVSASLEQLDVRMSLKIVTGGAWSHPDVTATAGRSLCVTLADGDPAIERGRICAATRSGRSALSYTSLGRDGKPGATRRLGARVTHPAPGLLQATFLPVAVGLSLGPYSWSVQSEWTDGAACASACVDRLPDVGAVPAELGLLGVPPCFGAAARDPQHPCDNPQLRLSVAPALARAGKLLDPFCDKRMRPGLLSICAFGAAPEDARSSFALIGDSHAASLKTAMEVVTLGKRWRGYSIFRATCPATKARPVLRTRARSGQCVRWNGEVLDWLRGHKEVQTVVLSAHSRATVAGAKPSGMYAALRAGYRSEIGALLGLGRRVVVVRDVPASNRNHLRCVASALEAKREPGVACSRPRANALRRDPLAAAAGAAGSSRVTVVDLTDQICDAKRCYAVVGGALVQHDQTHLTYDFSSTLGPFILRALGG
jgi:hypothetical protein